MSSNIEKEINNSRNKNYMNSKANNNKKNQNNDDIDDKSV